MAATARRRRRPAVNRGRYPSINRGNRRRRPGFWSGVKYHTHTDHFRYRIGGSVGRLLLAGWNRLFPNRQAPIRGTWTDGIERRSSGRLESWRAGSEVKANPRPRREGPGVKVYPRSPNPRPRREGPGVTVYPRGTKLKRRKLPGGTYMDGRTGLFGGKQGGTTGRAAATPINMSDGATRSASRPAHTIKIKVDAPTIGGLAGQRQTPGEPAPSGQSTSAPSVTREISTPESNEGGRTMSQPTNGGGGNFDGLGQAPETDAAHAAFMESFSMTLNDACEQLREHREMLEGEVNMHSSVLGGLDEAAEHLGEASLAVTTHAQDYQSAYEGVRETAAATEGKIPGMDPNSGYWSETA